MRTSHKAAADSIPSIHFPRRGIVLILSDVLVRQGFEETRGCPSDSIGNRFGFDKERLKGQTGMRSEVPLVASPSPSRPDPRRVTSLGEQI